MKLIPDWKDVIYRAHSMWAYYASFACLLLPEAIFWLFEIDTNPRIWWFLGVALLVYGIIGRLKDQSLNRDKTRSPALVGALAIGLVLAFGMSPNGTAQAMSKKPSVEVVTPDVAVTPRGGSAYDTAFLEVAVPFIGRWEGLRLSAYLDIVGVPTVCYGETKGVLMGDTYTKAQCDAMFSREVLDYRNRLRPAFTSDTVADRLTLERDVAYASLAYNVGVHGTGKSTAVRRLNQGDIAGACQALGWWNKAGGRVVRGLVNRRTEETELCMRGVV
jgi:GH24 family phage-related lysozyme (muramidase)